MGFFIGTLIGFIVGYVTYYIRMRIKLNKIIKASKNLKEYLNGRNS